MGVSAVDEWYTHLIPYKRRQFHQIYHFILLSTTILKYQSIVVYLICDITININEQIEKKLGQPTWRRIQEPNQNIDHPLEGGIWI